jgi:hypothetical protein
MGGHSMGKMETDVLIVPGGKGKRSRHSTTPLPEFLDLSAAQRAVLVKWLKSDAGERRWQGLLELAGADHLDTAQSLLQVLLGAGAVAVKEVFLHGQWRPVGVVWRDLEALQRMAQVPTRRERDAHKEGLETQLQALGQVHPWLAPAVHSCLNSAWPAATQLARAQLLQALVLWQQGQRQGLRQDFALAARDHTKAITAAEWDWLDATLSLESMGVGRFAPLLWFGGSVALRMAADGLDASPHPEVLVAPQGLGFVGVPCERLCAPLEVRTPPQSYWLIENRASFERQTAKLAAGVCLIWLPGRPGAAWLKAMRWLLAQAPAPATISCDPDPAGIQIAMTAGQLWTEAGLAWQAGHMAPNCWQDGKTLPLNDYDRRVLAELGGNGMLPLSLAALRDYLLSSGTKAEQEGWL